MIEDKLAEIDHKIKTYKDQVDFYDSLVVKYNREKNLELVKFFRERKVEYSAKIRKCNIEKRVVSYSNRRR